MPAASQSAKASRFCGNWGAEPLSRLKPGGSGRNHRPLDAAAAHMGDTSALESIDWRPFEPPTHVSLGSTGGRPKATGRRLPHAGLVSDGLLVRRRHGWAPTPARPPGPDPRRAGMSLDERSAPDTPRRDPVAHW